MVAAGVLQRGIMARVKRLESKVRKLNDGLCASSSASSVSSFVVVLCRRGRYRTTMEEGRRSEFGVPIAEEHSKGSSGSVVEVLNYFASLRPP